MPCAGRGGRRAHTAPASSPSPAGHRDPQQTCPHPCPHAWALGSTLWLLPARHELCSPLLPLHQDWAVPKPLWQLSCVGCWGPGRQHQEWSWELWPCGEMSCSPSPQSCSPELQGHQDPLLGVHDLAQSHCQLPIGCHQSNVGPKWVLPQLQTFRWFSIPTQADTGRTTQPWDSCVPFHCCRNAQESDQLRQITRPTHCPPAAQQRGKQRLLNYHQREKSLMPSKTSARS